MLQLATYSLSLVIVSQRTRDTRHDKTAAGRGAATLRTKLNIKLGVAYLICEPRAISLWAEMRKEKAGSAWHSRPPQLACLGLNLEVDNRLVLARGALEHPVVHTRIEILGRELQAVGGAAWANAVGAARADDRTVRRGQPEADLLVGLEEVLW
jgi:hypothetical protein